MDEKEARYRQKLERMGEPAARKRLDQIGSLPPDKAVWLSHWIAEKDRERENRESGFNEAQINEAREANTLAREANTFAKEANSFASDANELAKIANRKARNANIAAIIALIIAIASEAPKIISWLHCTK